MSAVDPLTVACPACGSSVGAACYPVAGMTPPHAARCHLARRQARWALDDLRDLVEASQPGEIVAMLELLRARQAMPRGFDAVVRVSLYGSRKHGADDHAIAPGTTAAECAEHMVAHAERADVDAASRDPETNELDAAHAAMRGIMLAEIEARL